MYASEVRTAKQPFEMANLVRFVEEATKDGLGKADIQIWASPLASTAHLASTIVSLLATATEPENVMKSKSRGLSSLRLMG